MSNNRKSEEMYKIGRAAKAAGVSRQSLQYYLMVGVVEPTCRTVSGQRLFDSEAIRKIRLIKELNESGYTLRDIREIFIERKKQAKITKLIENSHPKG